MNETKNFLFGENVQVNLLQGMKVAHDAVFQTTQDSYKIVQNLKLPNQYLDSGLAMMRETAGKMEKKCGDGVTFALLLLYKMCEESLKYIQSNHCPFSLTQALEDGAEEVLTSIEKDIVPFEFDEASGLLIYSDSLTAELNDAKVLLFDKNISSPHQLLPLLQEMLLTHQSLLIAAHVIDGDTLSTLTLNNLQGRLHITAFSTPSSSCLRKRFLDGVSQVTGARIVTKEPTPSDLGFAKKIVIQRSTKIEASAFHFPINNSENPALKILESAFNWASDYSNSNITIETIIFAFQTALHSTRIFLLSQVLILEQNQ